MTIDDLTVNFAYLDADRLLSDWRWLIDSSKSRFVRLISSASKLPVLITAGGNAFVQDVKSGTVHYLDTVEGTLAQVCTSPQDFRQQLSKQEFVTQHLSIEMVSALRQAGVTLLPKQVYSFKVPPALGGQFDLSNIEASDIELHFSISGQIHRQIANVSAGTQIKNIKLR